MANNDETREKVRWATVRSWRDYAETNANGPKKWSRTPIARKETLAATKTVDCEETISSGIGLAIHAITYQKIGI